MNSEPSTVEQGVAFSKEQDPPKIEYSKERYDKAWNVAWMEFPPSLEEIRGTFQWPIAPGFSAEIISYPGERDDFGLHDGVDLKAPAGTRIIAPYGGRVLIEGDIERNKAWNVSLGDVFVFDEKTGLWQVFAHLDLDQIKDNLKDGQLLHQGEPVGIIGRFEHSDTKLHHLHYQLMHSNLKFFELPLIKSRSVNPLHLLEDLRTK